MIPLRMNVKFALIFVAVGIAAGVGIVLFVFQIFHGNIIYQMEVEDSGNPFSNPEFLKSYQENVRVGALYKSKLAVGEDGFFESGANGGTKPYQFEWKFSDGIDFSTQNVTRSFDTPGQYSAVVTAVDSKGVHNTVTIRYEVVSTPEK